MKNMKKYLNLFIFNTQIYYFMNVRKNIKKKLLKYKINRNKKKIKMR